jgi:hypothetical protein
MSSPKKLLGIAAVFALIPVGWYGVGRAAPAPRAPSFPDVLHYKAGVGNRGVVAIDLNGDRVLDLVTANAAADTISVLTGTGNGTFAAERTFASAGHAPYAVAAGRLDGDAFPDVVTVDLSSASASVFLNDGHGGLRPPSSIPLGGGPVAVQTADLDRDGLDDVIVADVSRHAVRVLLNRGNDGFAAPLVLATGGTAPKSVVAADFTNDGRLDLAAVNSRSNDVSILVARGDGTYADPLRVATIAAPQSLAAVDVDHNGWLDIVTASADASAVAVLRSRKDGTFDAAKAYDVRSPRQIRGVDLNGDGAPDLVVSQADRDSVALLLNDGAGAFGASIELPVDGGHPTELAIGDLDGDGTPDVVTANEGSSDVSILLQNIPLPRVQRFAPGPNARVNAIDGRLQQPITASFNTALDRASLNAPGILVYGSQSGFHAAAVDYAEADHLVTLRPDAANAFRPGESVTVYFTSRIRSARGMPVARGVSHTFTVQPQKGSGQFVEVERVQCDKIPGTLKAADFNNDGRMDIVALCREVDGIRVHLNRGNGKFDFDHHLLLKTGGFGPWDLVPADLNNDGLIDIAVVNTFSSNLAVFRNLGNGEFASPLILPCGAGPMGIAAGDVNGDGFMDLAVAAKGFPEVLVFVNRGGKDISLAPPQRYGVAPSPYSVTIRDLDTDGAPDLIMTNLESDRGTFLMNKGDGTFRSPEEFPLVLAKALVDDPVDVDNDGKTDIVTVNTASDDISVLLNTGGSNFSARKNIPVGLTPTDQVFGDFNSDGFIDVALTLDGGDVAIMLNDRKGGFLKGGVVKVGRNPTSPVSADINGDGTLDLVIANQYSKDISVLINLPAKVTARK